MQQHFKTWNMYFFFRVGNVSSPQRWCLRSLRAPERWLPSTWSHWTPHTSTTEAETSSALDLQLQEHVCSPETLRIMENTSLLHAQRSQTSSTAHLVSNPSLSGSFNEYACIPGSHLAGKCPCRPCRPGKSWRLGGKKDQDVRHHQTWRCIQRSGAAETGKVEVMSFWELKSSNVQVIFL